jgi:hypothetical protein
LALLKNFKDVKAKPITNYKAGIMEGIQEAVEEVNMIRKGTLKGISAKDLLNEL